MPEVVTMIDKVLGYSAKKLFVAGGVGLPKIILRFDQAAAHEVSPHAIDDGTSEEWVFRRRQPIGEITTAILARRGSLAIQRRGGHGRAAARMQDIAARL